MKKLIAMLLCLVLLMCGCTGNSDSTEPNSTDDLTLALVVAGTFGDRSFYDSSKEGCDRLAKEGVTVKTIECNNDPSAQIFSIAHYCIADDLYQVVPRLTELVKNGKEGE